MVDLQTLYLEALAERTRRPDRLGERAEALAALAGSDARWLARAQVLRAWAFMARGEAARGELLVRDALAALERLGDDAGAALARMVSSGCLCNLGELEKALEVMEPVWRLPANSRTPLEWAYSASRMVTNLERLGRHDDALVWHYRHLAYARRSGDAAALATALGTAAGLQLSLHNLEDAEPLSAEAWRIVQAEGREWHHTPLIVMPNCMMVLHFLGRHDEALVLAEALREPPFARNPHSEGKRQLLMALVFAHAGRAAEAQALLDEGLAAGARERAPPIEWALAQARLHNDAGHHAEALSVCEAHAQARQAGRLPAAEMPSDLVLLHTEAARAREALGDYAGALAEQRAVTTAERELVGVAARARRLTLQIRYELDEARRREREAAREQARLAELNITLAEADAAKSRFLAAASHDLRQPMHALGLQLAQLRGCDDEAGREQLLLRMERTLGGLASMFDALLDISRMDAGVVAPRRRVLALQPLLTRLVEEFQPLAAAKGLRLALRLRPEAHTDSDPQLLESMLRNLLANALKYTSAGGVLVAVRPRQTHWLVQVRDSGPGIAEAQHERIFEEFFRLGAPAGPGGAGADTRLAGPNDRSLGLGLAITRRLAHLLGHTLTLRSRPGAGSCFGVQLLRAAPAAALAPSEPPPGALQRFGVAVIEDDHEIRASLSALLAQWGHDVVAGATADEVIAQHRQASRPALRAIIADRRLADGARGDDEARRLLAGVAEGAAVLVVTGERIDAPAGAPSPAAFACLPKPVHPARLRAWLAGVCPVGEPSVQRPLAAQPGRRS